MEIQLLDGAEVERATPWDRLLEALADGVTTAELTCPERHVHTMAGPDGTDSSLLLMPAWDTAPTAGGLIGTKLVTFVPANGAQGAPSIQAVYVVFDRTSGRPLAMLDGDTLTTRRTAAISALGSRLLAQRATARLLVVGSGQLVPAVVAAHVATSDVEQVEIWGRNPARVRTVVDALAPTVDVPVDAADDLDEAVARADVVVAATSSSAPLVRGSVVRPGTHVSLLGSFRPDLRESDDALVTRATIFVDALPGALTSGDLAQPLERGVLPPSAIHGDLAALVRRSRAAGGGPIDVVPDGTDLTVFKSVGFAAADLLAAKLVLGRA